MGFFFAAAAAVALRLATAAAAIRGSDVCSYCDTSYGENKK
jgi:hypothetical protein